MTLVTITQAKANLSKLIAMVERGGGVTIGRAGKPMVTLASFQPAKKPVKLGVLKGKIWIAPDFDEWPEEKPRALGITH